MPQPAQDISLQHLGYATDNGAFYYGNTEKLGNGSRTTYEQTLLDVHTDAVSIQL